MILEGIVHKFGDNVDTDAIVPARYLDTTDPAELAPHCLETIDQQFAARVKSGDLIVAGDNFGCGSSREHAPLAIKGCGVAGLVAKSFARIFLRNAINIGLPVFESPEAAEQAASGHRLQVDADRGVIVNLTLGKEYTTQPLPEFLQQIVASGGLVNYVRARLGTHG